jgi:hypothetical protein
MATKTKAATKPAPKQAEEKPAVAKPAAPEGVGIKELAKDLNRTPKSVRAAIRRLKGGPQVGKGGRYHFESKKDPAYQDLFKALASKEKADA